MGNERAHLHAHSTTNNNSAQSNVPSKNLSCLDLSWVLSHPSACICYSASLNPHWLLQRHLKSRRHSTTPTKKFWCCLCLQNFPKQTIWSQPTTNKDDSHTCSRSLVCKMLPALNPHMAGPVITWNSMCMCGATPPPSSKITQKYMSTTHTSTGQPRTKIIHKNVSVDKYVFKSLDTICSSYSWWCPVPRSLLMAQR